MYKKYAVFLAAICLIPTAVLAEDVVTHALRGSFEQQTQACSPLLSALELEVPGLLHEFYTQGLFTPQWQATSRRAALLRELEQLADDGLDPDFYRIDRLRQPPAPSASAQEQACFDLLISRSYLQALQHLSRGRLNQEQIDPLWRAPDSNSPPLRPSVLSLAWEGLAPADGAGLVAAFTAARPSLPQYQALRRVYAELRRQPLPHWVQVPAGRVLKPGEQDPRVPLLAARLASQGWLGEDAQPLDEHYSPALVSAVKRFQQRHGLQDDGILGPASLRALNISSETRLEQVRINLERWRWLAGDLEPETLLVDIAGGWLTYYRAAQPYWRGRVQVGRIGRQTPRLKSLVNRLTLNPTWTVPPTIMREDKLPAIRRDRAYLDQHQLSVLDPQGNRLDPTSIDWSRPGNIMLRQSAGPENPLGKLVIRFPNPFSVYLHDTPSQHLFIKSPRDFSSGCVRVEGVFQLLEQILPSPALSTVMQKLSNGRTQQYGIQRRLPIVMAYWTAEVEPNGELVLRNDIYDLDQRLSQALSTALN